MGLVTEERPDGYIGEKTNNTKKFKKEKTLLAYR